MVKDRRKFIGRCCANVTPST